MYLSIAAFTWPDMRLFFSEFFFADGVSESLSNVLELLLWLELLVLRDLLLLLLELGPKDLVEFVDLVPISWSLSRMLSDTGIDLTNKIGPSDLPCKTEQTLFFHLRRSHLYQPFVSYY